MSSTVNRTSCSFSVAELFPEASLYSKRQDLIEYIQDRAFSSNFALSISRSNEKSTFFLCDQAGEPRQRKSSNNTGSENPSITVQSRLTSSKSVAASLKLLYVENCLMGFVSKI
ncbi:hypothetical protein GEMRC1_009565 [Eukaryota sp. GEM-RC1]